MYLYGRKEPIYKLKIRLKDSSKTTLSHFCVDSSGVCRYNNTHKEKTTYHIEIL